MCWQKQNLGPRDRSEEFVREIDAFGDQPLGLAEKLRIQNGQQRRVVVDIVFDEEYGLDADQTRVMVDIHSVFEMLDDADDQPEIPLPDENAVECGSVVVRFEVFQFSAVICQQHDRDLTPASLASWASRTAVISSTCIVVRIRSNRRSSFARAMASLPLDTRVSSGEWLRFRL